MLKREQHMTSKAYHVRIVLGVFEKGIDLVDVIRSVEIDLLIANFVTAVSTTFSAHPDELE